MSAGTAIGLPALSASGTGSNASWATFGLAQAPLNAIRTPSTRRNDAPISVMSSHVVPARPSPGKTAQGWLIGPRATTVLCQTKGTWDGRAASDEMGGTTRLAHASLGLVAPYWLATGPYVASPTT
jgi:hypothetical protein